MHLDIASYKFDSRYMFILCDKMDHFKEQASYICNWAEECLRKDDNILQCLKQIAVLQKIVVDNHFKEDKIIKGKEEMVKLLSEEVYKHTDVAQKAIQSMRVVYEEYLEKANAKASELKEELKKRPPVLNVPPVRIEMGPLQVMEKKIKEYE